jgi:hypothetical protein
MCLEFLYLQLWSATFLSLRSIQGDIIINVYRRSCKVPVCYSCQILMKTEFSRQIVEKF